MNATIYTSKGAFDVELFEKDAPHTVANFAKLAKSGFYDGTRFHRVIAGFMIQAGDPLTRDEAQKEKWGTGGPGYSFADEIHEHNHNARGTIAMANAGPNTNGSQFFINVADNDFLDAKHTVFGRLTGNRTDVVEQIANTPTDENDRPLLSILIERIAIT